MRFASHVELWRKGMKANARRKGRKGKRARGERREWERGKRPGRLRSPLSLFPFPSVCVPSRCTRCSERATSLARSTHYGSPPYVWGEMHCWYGSRPVPRGKAMRWARAFSLSFVRSLVRSSFHCGQSIAMNSCECSTTNTHSPSFLIRTASSLFDAKPLYAADFDLLIVFSTIR